MKLVRQLSGTLLVAALGGEFRRFVIAVPQCRLLTQAWGKRALAHISAERRFVASCCEEEFA